jgi:hypothetical protein
LKVRFDTDFTDYHRFRLSDLAIIRPRSSVPICANPCLPWCSWFLDNDFPGLRHFIFRFCILAGRRFCFLFEINDKQICGVVGKGFAKSLPSEIGLIRVVQ